VTTTGPGATTEVRPVTPRRGPDRGLRRAFALLIVAVSVAVLKPWGAGPPIEPAAVPVETAASTRGDAVPIVPQPRVDATVDRCYAGLAWRLFTIQRDFGRLARWLQRLDTLPAARGVLDPSIPTIEVVSEETEGLGFCAPYREDPGAVRSVSAWQIDPVAGPLTLSLEPIPDEIPGSHGAVFAPPRLGSAAGERYWPAGHFVFLVGSPAEDMPVAWFGVHVEARTARR